MHECVEARKSRQFSSEIPTIMTGVMQQEQNVQLHKRKYFDF